jgi:hypothetical protein
VRVTLPSADALAPALGVELRAPQPELPLAKELRGAGSLEALNCAGKSARVLATAEHLTKRPKTSLARGAGAPRRRRRSGLARTR